MPTKQIPALPPLGEAPADDDRFVLRDTSSGSDVSLRVDRFLERSGEQVSEHATETGGIHGIPEGERAINSQELLAAVSEAADIDEAVSFVGKGAIVESGTNANGSYVRWENGEQVCFFTNLSVLIDDSGFSSEIFVTSVDDLAQWDFPASFSSTPSISTGLSDSRIAWASAFQGASSSGALLNAFSFSSGSRTLHATAWGFWK